MERDERGEEPPGVGLDSCGGERADALVSLSTDSTSDIDVAPIVEQHEIEARVAGASGFPIDDGSDRLVSGEKVSVVPVAVHRVRAPQDRRIGRAADVDDLAEEDGGFSAGRAYRCVHGEELDVSDDQRADEAFGPVATLRNRVLVRLPEVEHLGGVRVFEQLRHGAVAAPLQRVGAR